MQKAKKAKYCKRYLSLIKTIKSNDKSLKQTILSNPPNISEQVYNSEAYWTIREYANDATLLLL